MTDVGAAFGASHMDYLDAAGIDLQIISPRPYQMMHSEQPSKIVEWFTEETNNMIHRMHDPVPRPLCRYGRNATDAVD